MSKILLALMTINAAAFGIFSESKLRELYMEGEPVSRSSIKEAMTGRCFSGGEIYPTAIVPVPDYETNYIHPDDTGPIGPKEVFIRHTSRLAIVRRGNMTKAAKELGFKRLKYEAPNTFDRISKFDRPIYERAVRNMFDSGIAPKMKDFAKNGEYFIEKNSWGMCYYFDKIKGAKPIQTCEFGWLGFDERRCSVFTPSETILSFTSFRCDHRVIAKELTEDQKKSCLSVIPAKTSDEYEIGKAKDL